MEDKFFNLLKNVSPNLRMYAAAFFIATGCGFMSSLGAQTPNFVPGQVLMRFADGTPERAKVNEASRTNPPDVTSLRPVIDTLSQRVGMALSVERIGSGSWLTIAIARSPLIENVGGHLRGENGVAAVNRQGADLQITMDAGSALEQAFYRRSQTDTFAQVVDGWSTAAGVPLLAAAETDHLVIQIDWSAATLELVERLNERPEVEAAQPNYSQVR